MKYISQLFEYDFVDYMVIVRQLPRPTAEKYLCYTSNAFKHTLHVDFSITIQSEKDPKNQLLICDWVISALSNTTLADNTKARYTTGINHLKNYICHINNLTNPSLNRKIVKEKKNPENHTTPSLKIEFGKDEERGCVYYDGVSENKQVPGLCSWICELYSNIIHFARNLFCEFVEIDWEMDRIEIRLCDKCPIKSWPKGDYYLSKEIFNANNKKERKLTVNEIHEILKEKNFTDKVLGRYISSEAVIEIYYMNFRANNLFELVSMIYNTIAHEYMHYLEHKYCSIKKKKAFTNDFLSEPMAEFFGLLCSINYGYPEYIEVAKHRYDSWITREESHWPYAEALYFFKVNSKHLTFISNINYYYDNDSIKKLQIVFSECHIPKKSYKTLKNF